MNVCKAGLAVCSLTLFLAVNAVAQSAAPGSAQTGERRYIFQPRRRREPHGSFNLRERQSRPSH